jgi:hypothetical protein
MRTILPAICLTLLFSMQAHADDVTVNPQVTDATTHEQMMPADEQATDTPENRGPLTATDKIVNRFMELDTDTSEGVSFEEYMTMVQQRATDRFASMDANEDGEVTAEEYREFWKARKAQYYRPKR